MKIEREFNAENENQYQLYLFTKKIFNELFRDLDFEIDDELLYCVQRYSKSGKNSKAGTVLKNACLTWFLKNRKHDLDFDAFKENYRIFFDSMNNYLWKHE